MGEGTATGVEAISTAMVNLATNVGNNVMTMLGQIVPVLAPVVAAIIIIYLGRKIITKFSGGGR